MTIVKYMRPSGRTIEVNDTAETRALAESMGWVIEEDRKPVEALKASKADQPKRGRKA